MPFTMRFSAVLLLPFLAGNRWAQAPPKAGSNAAAQVPVQTQDITGDWQGTLMGDGAALRAVLLIARKPGGGYSANFYTIDEGPDPIPVEVVTLKGSHVSFSIPSIQGHYDGVLQPDGASIRGKWTQDGPGPLNFERPTAANKWPTDISPHTVSFIPVESKVKLEVLDWGGTGRPLVLLAGLGDTAHAFDKFAPKLTSKYHVYGITRRGFGASTHPNPANLANYKADRLGDDVLAVLAALKLKNAVLAGHSFAGEELSSVGSRHPDRVAGLIYLDAGYGYAFYDPALGDYTIDLIELRRKLNQLTPDTASQDEQSILKQLQADLPRFERDVQNQMDIDAAMPDGAAPPPPPGPPSPPSPETAVVLGQQKYTSLPVPVLAIFAVPHKYDDLYPNDPKAVATAQAQDIKRMTALTDSFEHGVPSAKVIRLKNADHYIFNSNEARVIREVDIFIAALP
jgi:non-heme chloroperoxidase